MKIKEREEDTAFEELGELVDHAATQGVGQHCELGRHIFCYLPGCGNFCEDLHVHEHEDIVLHVFCTPDATLQFRLLDTALAIRGKAWGRAGDGIRRALAGAGRRGEGEK